MGLKIKSQNRGENNVYPNAAPDSGNWRISTPDAPEVMTLEEVAAFVGVCEKSIKKLIEEEGFPHRRIGERWLFGRRAVVRWINGED